MQDDIDERLREQVDQYLEEAFGVEVSWRTVPMPTIPVKRVR